MVDMVLLAGKLVLLALIYLFLFAAVRSGIGIVRDTGPFATRGTPSLEILHGPRELLGKKVPVAGPVTIGRSPGSDIVIVDDFISSRHARVIPAGEGMLLEDLGSTNGTLVNGQRITAPVRLDAGDEIDLGTVKMKVAYL